ncbi:MAG: phosphoenolpyruvate carboxykinase (ATP), partial [SAR324 cluster bacterium]|nr:phosphoenolpyruvate carboxykinase (ATP) [SAR324 cluster bacterium]
MGFFVRLFFRNTSPAILYEEALLYETDSAVSDTGAMIVSSSEKTGRSPKDKRIVTTPEFIDDIWWGDVNIGIDEDTF